MRTPAPPCWRGQTDRRPEIVLGRILAACAHPAAGWMLLSARWRALMLAAYAMTGYVGVLGLLLL